MDDLKIKEMFWECYNGFWGKYKEPAIPKDSPLWDQITAEAGAIMEKYNCKTCNSIMMFFMGELEERSKHGE